MFEQSLLCAVLVRQKRLVHVILAGAKLRRSATSVTCVRAGLRRDPLKPCPARGDAREPLGARASSPSVSGIRALPRLAGELLDLAFSLHLLVVDDGTDAIFHRANDLFGGAFGALCSLRGELSRLASELFGLALGLHLLVADQVTNGLLDLAAKFFCFAFGTVACVAHEIAPFVNRIRDAFVREEIRKERAHADRS